MEKVELSRANLVKFLDFAAEKGLMNSKTAVGYKKACSAVLGILDETEAADLSKIDLENVIVRHRNLAAGKVLPATLKSYEARTRAAIKNFVAYAKDPSVWKPSIKPRSPRTPTAKEPKADTSAAEPKFEKKEMPSSQPSVHIDLQIHISPEATPEQIEQIFASVRHHLYRTE